MNEIRPNSHKSKEELTTQEKKIQPVVKPGRARTKKQSTGSKVLGSIISEDANNVKSYIVGDVLIPSFKKAISDIVTNGIDIILYGEAGHTKRQGSNAGKVRYSQYYDRDVLSRNRGASRSTERPARQQVSIFDEVVVDSKREGEDIIEHMSEYLDNYPVISVADMYDIAGITQFSHTANNYGWKSVVDAKVVRTSDGEYLIKMPKPSPLK